MTPMTTPPTPSAEETLREEILRVLNAKDYQSALLMPEAVLKIIQREREKAAREACRGAVWQTWCWIGHPDHKHKSLVALHASIEKLLFPPSPHA